MYIDKVDNIIKVLNIVLPILLWAVTGLVSKTFNYMALTFFYSLVVKWAFYFKGFECISVTINKYNKWYVEIEIIEQIIC